MGYEQSKRKVWYALLVIVMAVCVALGIAFTGGRLSARADASIPEEWKITLMNGEGYNFVIKNSSQIDTESASDGTVAKVQNGDDFVVYFKLNPKYSKSTPTVAYRATTATADDYTEITSSAVQGDDGTYFTIPNTVITDDLIIFVVDGTVTKNKFTVSVPTEQEQVGYTMSIVGREVIGGETSVTVDEEVSVKFVKTNTNNKAIYKVAVNGTEDVAQFNHEDLYTMQVTADTHFTVNYYKPVQVVYAPNGGVGEATGQAEWYSQGEKVVIDFNNKFTREGYEFVGYSRNPSATNPEFKAGGTSSFTIAEGDNAKSCTLYAIWKVEGAADPMEVKDPFPLWALILIIVVPVVLILLIVLIYYGVKNRKMKKVYENAPVMVDANGNPLHQEAVKEDSKKKKKDKKEKKE